MRIPRPMGATTLSRQFQLNPIKENKHKLQRLILLSYIQQTLYYPTTIQTNLNPVAKDLKSLTSFKNKKTTIKTNKNRMQGISIKNVELISPDVLSIGLGLSLSQLQVKVNKLLANMSRKTLTDKGYNEMNELATRASLNGLIFKALGNSLIHHNWAQELQSVARINGYSPLQVKEANSAFANDLGYTKLAFDMLTKQLPIPDKASLNINTQINTGNVPHTDEHGMSFTPQQALQMLEEKGYSGRPLDIEALSLVHGLDDPNIPDVQALPSDAQGIKGFNIKDMAFTGHEDRRQEELGMVPVKPKKKPKKAKDLITIEI